MELTRHFVARICCREIIVEPLECFSQILHINVYLCQKERERKRKKGGELNESLGTHFSSALDQESPKKLPKKSGEKAEP